MKVIKLFLLFAFSLYLSSCGGILSPYGNIASEQKTLIIVSFVAMLVVVIPVLILTVVVSLKYREGNKKLKKYEPEWSHNIKLEIFWWSVPLVIVLFLSVLAWVTAHSLDPYKKIDSDKESVKVQAMSLNWKWLFIYPDYGIATVNYMKLPVDRPIDFELASDGPMNSFWMPQLAGQIYTMTGMPTQLHVLINKAGEYRGMSSNYSGEGFEGMKFKVSATTDEDFQDWVNEVKASKNVLSQETYDDLIKDSFNEPVKFYVVSDSKIFRNAMIKYMPSMAHKSEDNSSESKGMAKPESSHNEK